MGVCNSETNRGTNERENINPADKKIIKVNRSICKIISNTSNGFGFLIKLNINNNHLFCLMTNEHVIKRETVKNKENIKIKYDCESKEIIIKLDNTKRLIRDFININIDTTIVEILPKDNIGKHYFLSPEINNNKNVINNPIYIPQYSEEKNFNNSKGFIKEINDNFFLTHNSLTKSGTSGSPIFLENSINVIAIHKQGNINKKENYGFFIYPIIQELQNNSISKNNSNYNIYDKFNYNDGKYYIGPVINGIPNGKGKIYYKNGDLYYQGELKNGMKEGTGEIFFENGEYYSGQFTQDKIIGKGEYHYDNGYYIGDLINGIRNGKGKYYFSNGEIYEGDFVNNLKEGTGIYKYKDGDYYIGSWSKDLKNGKGKQFYKNGNLKSDIDFVNDKFEGYGKYINEDGSYYIGQWHNDLKNGKGKSYYKNGKLRFDGNFVDDKYEGYGEFFFEEGDYYKGYFKNDLKHGKGKEYYKNGIVKYEGDFVENRMDGFGRYNYLNGEFYIGQWFQGKKNGKGVLYNNNGIIKYNGFFLCGKFKG